MLLLHQVADDLVVEELNRFPLGWMQNTALTQSFPSVSLSLGGGLRDYLDVLRLIFLLLGLQCQLDEKLLQLLVAVVYTELFEAEEGRRPSDIRLSVLWCVPPHLFTQNTSNP